MEHELSRRELLAGAGAAGAAALAGCTSSTEDVEYFATTSTRHASVESAELVDPAIGGTSLELEVSVTGWEPAEHLAWVGPGGDVVEDRRLRREDQVLTLTNFGKPLFGAQRLEAVIGAEETEHGLSGGRVHGLLKFEVHEDV